MKTLYLFALASLAILVAASVSAYADDYYYGSGNTEISQYDTTRIEGCGSYVVQQQLTLTPIPEACCEIAPASCGAFCEAGQVTPGWPYNWCDEYWLRPDSNF